MNAGKLLVVAGLALALLGLLWLGLERFGIHPGRLPGDVVVRGERTTLYFPIVSCLVASLLLTLVLWLLRGSKP